MSHMPGGSAAFLCPSIYERISAVPPTSRPRPSIALSQNFLTNERLVAQLIDRSSIGPDDTVVEIGPGAGVITGPLARRCRCVVAIEKDERLAALLRRRFRDAARVAVRRADVLRAPLPDTPYKVFANIPFNVTTAIVSKLVTAPNPPGDCYLVVQREAAAKFAGTPRESLYAVLMKPWFEPSIVHTFRRGDFAPPPSVEVVMLRLRKRGPPLVAPTDARLYRDFVTYCFTARQPSLRHTLKTLFSPRQLRHIEKHLVLDLDIAPTAIPFERWLQLFHEFRRVGSARATQAVCGAEERLKRRQAGLQKVHRTRTRVRRHVH